MRKIIFITFGSSEQFANSLIRISNEAKKILVFDEIYAYNENNIKEDNVFWEKTLSVYRK
jgi:hypothetical protein